MFKNKKVIEKVKQFIRHEMIELSGNVTIAYLSRIDGPVKEDLEDPKFREGRMYEIENLKRALSEYLYK